MTSKALSTGLRVLVPKQRVLFSGSCPAVTSRVSVAYITGRSSRVEPQEKPKPWPYKEWGYNNFMAYIDGTLKRIGENSKVVVVEGPPAIGKSALARSLAEELEMKYFPMVTTDSYYINPYGYDMRKLDSQLPPHLQSYDEMAFVKNPKSEKVILLQTILWVQKFQQYVNALAHLLNTGEGVVLDRCAFSANVFTDTLVDMGYLTKLEREVLHAMQKRVMGDLLKPHLIVYLDAPPAVVEANLKKRGRGEEKVWNKEMLEKLEYHYKQNYLKTITQHAELVAYDWSEPGEAEVVVEDIENIDFDRFDIHDSKMEDWRLREAWDWSEKRYRFTHRANHLICKILNTEVIYKVPALMLDPEDDILLQKIYEENKVPGTKYQTGYNVDDGDKNILWSTQPFMPEWIDHEVQRASKK